MQRRQHDRDERTAAAPSGEQYDIAWGDSQAHISQVGATLRTFTVDGRDVIDGFPSDERSTDGRGQVLAPWPNRLTDGSYTYGGRDCQAPLNEPSRHDAIHGLVRWLDWSLLRHDPSQVTLVVRGAAAARVRVAARSRDHLRVGPGGLTVSLTAVNADDEPAPFGVGFHPYLTLGTTVDALELTVPATTFLDPDTPAERRDDDARRRDAARTSRGLVGFCRGVGYRVRRPRARERWAGCRPAVRSGQWPVRRAVGGRAATAT